MHRLTRRSLILGAATFASGLGPPPAPLATRVKLTLGYAKVAHLVAFLDIDKVLAPMGVDVEMVEFVRYADSRTAMASGSLDITPMAPGDLPLLVSQGVTSVIGLMGVAASPAYPIIRNDVKADTWDDLANLRLGVPPGSAVWYQFVAMIQEKGLRYNQFKIVNIQGAGTNFLIAMQHGDVDAFIQSEPTDSMPLAQGYGHPAVALDYSTPQAVGPELGLLTASRASLSDKREAVNRFLWAFMAKQNALAADQKAYATAIQHFCGLDEKVAGLIAAKIKLGGVLDADQLVRLAKFLAMTGIVTKDVSGEVAQYYDPSIVQAVITG
jgi:sulfonate transport system substrate-binding protein